MSATCSARAAIEGLAAFFLESTFIGLWISAATASRPACTSPPLGGFAGTLMSAYFILAATRDAAPVGTRSTGHDRAEMTDFWAIMTTRPSVRVHPPILGAVITGRW